MMELKKVLAGLEKLKAKGNLEIDIQNITTDSRKVTKGTLFIAIKGFQVDGHDFIMQANEKGAICVMVEAGANLKQLGIPEEITLIVAPDTRYAEAIVACNFYEEPSKKFKLIGVTGTKGKTTTTYMIKEILEKAGQKVGLIGTIENYIGGTSLGESSRTTPDSIELQQLFAKMAKAKVDTVVMEVSSQSLKLNRVAGTSFDIAVFTNLSEDHISKNEHPDMEDYFQSKCKLFEMCQVGFVNCDDIWAQKLLKKYSQNDIKTYGIDNTCNLLAKDITITNSYVDFKVKLGDKNERVKTNIPGRFSVYNSLAAISVCLKLGVSP